ncbi:TNFAIP3-interacting protein 3 isoform X2 [Ascaphus truei]|uniref:TNFAIP3-interacting protein 3 isoform X2 n=1 Tax=Ascaphus truei TaxID=8439 RepID=UPI003F5A42E7
MSTTEPSVKLPQCLVETRKQDNMSAMAYEQKIHLLEKQREELLEVNKQWDHQFRHMKQIYEKKVAELKVKLSSCQHNIEEEHKQKQKKTEEKTLAKEPCIQHLKAKDTILVELQEIEEENQRLRKQNSLFSKRKEHYECEINRLNKALLEAIQKESVLVTEPYLNPAAMNVDRDDMLTQIEVLKQQIKIYEDDFKKERTDRVRINEEKEKLQKINERLRCQLSKINTKTKDLKQHHNPRQGFLPQLRSPPVDKCGNYELATHYQDLTMAAHATPQLPQNQQHKTHVPDYQWYVPDQLPPDVRQKENGSSLKQNLPPK